MAINPTQVILTGADASGNNMGILPSVPGVADWHFVGTSSILTKKNLITPAMGAPAILPFSAH